MVRPSGARAGVEVAQTSKSANYWLRGLGAGTMLAVLLLLWWERQGVVLNLGGVLFRKMSLTLFAAIWVLAPLLTADCISHERREGTLGLLLLTPLNAHDVVIAKGLVHASQALTFGSSATAPTRSWPRWAVAGRQIPSRCGWPRGASGEPGRTTRRRPAACSGRHFLKDEAEDIYIRADGKPFHDQR